MVCRHGPYKSLLELSFGVDIIFRHIHIEQLIEFAGTPLITWTEKNGCLLGSPLVKRPRPYVCG